MGQFRYRITFALIGDRFFRQNEGIELTVSICVIEGKNRTLQKPKAAAPKSRRDKPKKSMRASRSILRTWGAAGCAPTHFVAKLFAGGADEVGQEAVAGGVDAGVVFDEGEAEDVEIEADGGAAAFEIGERIAGEE